MFKHRQINSENVDRDWRNLSQTISRDRAFHAAESIATVSAEDMLDLAKRCKEDIDRIYFKLRDGFPMASGMRKVLPNADVQYIISQEKQVYANERAPISFWEPYDGYKSDTIWFADPINATGHTTIESLRYARTYFQFDTALVSHIAANVAGIQTVQTTLDDDFEVEGFMNYAYLSHELDPKNGYMKDGLQYIPDFGDKVFGTLGSDFSIYEMQASLRKLLGTGVGDVELVRGFILQLLQLRESDQYVADRKAAWMTRPWIQAALQWYAATNSIPKTIQIAPKQIDALLLDLGLQDFVNIEQRAYHQGAVPIYRLTDDGGIYSRQVYSPVLGEGGLLRDLIDHFDFLVHLRAQEILQSIDDMEVA